MAFQIAYFALRWVSSVKVSWTELGRRGRIWLKLGYCCRPKIILVGENVCSERNKTRENLIYHILNVCLLMYVCQPQLIIYENINPVCFHLHLLSTIVTLMLTITFFETQAFCF